MRKTWLACAGVLAVGTLVSTPALAVTIPGTRDVNATVQGGCTVGTTAVSFGDYSGAQLDAQGAINVNCTADLAYSVELGAGNGATTTRRMPKVGDPTTFLPYELYQDTNRSVVWGGTTAGYTLNGATALTGQTGTGAQVAIPVFGRIDAAQPLSAGSFADVVTVSVIY